MSETLTKTQPELPIFDESRGISPNFYLQQADLERLKTAETGPVDIEFLLPEVVGFVPQEERDLFDSLAFETSEGEVHGRYPGIGGDMNADGLRKFFPSVFNAIEQDLARLGAVPLGADPFRAEFERREVQAGEIARGKSKFIHVDLLGENAHVYYLIANTHGTEYVEGKGSVVVVSENNKRWLKSGVSGDFDSSVIAPNYGIVRMHPLTAHNSPQFAENAFRTFSRIHISTTPLKLPTLIS